MLVSHHQERLPVQDNTAPHPEVGRITVNLPGVKAFFPQEGFDAVLIETHGEQVLLKGINDPKKQNPKAVPVEARQNAVIGEGSGIKLRLNGKEAIKLRDLFLSKMNGQPVPFFTLVPSHDGMVEVGEQFETIPPRTEPHIRFWLPKDNSRRRQQPTVSMPMVAPRPRERAAAPVMALMTTQPTAASDHRADALLGPFLQRIRRAQNMVASFGPTLEGAPRPAEVENAQAIVSRVITLGRELQCSFGEDPSRHDQLIALKSQIEEFGVALKPAFEVTRRFEMLSEEIKRLSVPKPVLSEAVTDLDSADVSPPEAAEPVTAAPEPTREEPATIEPAISTKVQDSRPVVTQVPPGKSGLKRKISVRQPRPDGPQVDPLPPQAISIPEPAPVEAIEEPLPERRQSNRVTSMAEWRPELPARLFLIPDEEAAEAEALAKAEEGSAALPAWVACLNDYRENMRSVIQVRGTQRRTG